MTIEKTYQPQDIEQQWYQTWEKENYFAPKGTGSVYCIMIPPPNVTGSLHMGHGFGYTMMDVLVRYHRMKGDNTLWQPGTDHAGISTQMVVERQLLMEGKTRQEMGRDAFVEKIWEWKNESGGNITRQLRRLGASVDWKRERFTMDDTLSCAVREVFIQLHKEGLIYRGTRLVNWDPKLLTAISDLEVISTEEEGKLWHIRYPFVNEGEQESLPVFPADETAPAIDAHIPYIIVATTRPETLLGDVAVAVNPEDERYKNLIGKHVKLPLTGRTIPIIADDYVDKEFGSGCVKITPAHDFNDYAVGQRHSLSPINIFTPDAHINENAPKQYQGLDRFAAREQIIKDLEVLGLLEKTEKHISKIPRGEKSGVIVEPYLTLQWFMKMKPLAEPALSAVEKGDVQFIPENWTKTYFQWLNNIEDWCISRQLWWGHRIPVWYDEAGNHYAGHDEKDVRARHQLAENILLRQDEDVLDTWFSSALWPFSSLGWPENTIDFNTFFPTQILVTGFDIIFFWVARMIMMSLKFTGKVPFKDVFITGLIRDAEGQKMSKSKGNVLDPIDLTDGITLEALIQKRTYGLMQPMMAQKIEKATRKQFPDGISAYGTDALRFTFCALASHGREIRFDLGRLDGYRHFCNKLWNAARYVLMNTEEKEISPDQLSLPDHWILSKLQTTIQSVHEALASYRFDLLAQALYEFTWNEFCDWYLELSKPILLSGTEQQQRGTRHTLVTVLEQVLRLLHPVMPFITEEIWQRVAPLAGITAKTIMLQPYPEVTAKLKDEKIELETEWVKNIIVAIRTVRSQLNIAPGKPLSVLLSRGNASDKKRFEQHHHLIATLAKLSDTTWLAANDPYPESATALVGELEILIPMAGLIDKNEESGRLSREIDKLKKEMERTETRLLNPDFTARAPKDVIDKERVRLDELKMALEKSKQQLERIAAL